jgi:AbrB family looped-hinge helix DNA binding protein
MDAICRLVAKAQHDLSKLENIVASKADLPYKQNPRLDTIMSTLTITAKGQVTLRKDVLRHLGVGPGDKIIVDALPDGRIEVKAARVRGRISDVFNFLKREGGPSLSVEEINKIAAGGWAGKR